jgi:hypothetical protein
LDRRAKATAFPRSEHLDARHRQREKVHVHSVRIHVRESSFTDIEKPRQEGAGQRVATASRGRRSDGRPGRVVDQAQEFEIEIGPTLPHDVTDGCRDFRNDERLLRRDFAQPGLRGV